MSILTPRRVTIEVSGIEVLCLQKLSLVSHALASKLTLSARLEQETLARTLDDVLRRIQIAAAAGEKADAS